MLLTLALAPAIACAQEEIPAAVEPAVEPPAKAEEDKSDLQRDMGLLLVDADGLWHEYTPEEQTR